MNEEEKRIDELKDSIDEIEEEIGFEMFVNVVEEENAKEEEITKKIEKCEKLKREYIEKIEKLRQKSSDVNSSYDKVKADLIEEIEKLRKMRAKLENRRGNAGKEKAGATAVAASAEKKAGKKAIEAQKKAGATAVAASAKEEAKEKGEEIAKIATRENKEEIANMAKRENSKEIAKIAKREDEETAKIAKRKNGEGIAKIAKKEKEEEIAKIEKRKNGKEIDEVPKPKDDKKDENVKEEGEAQNGKNDDEESNEKGEEKTAKAAKNEDESSEDEESTVYKLMKEYESDSEDKLNKRYPEENDEDYVPSEEESKESIEHNSDAEISQDAGDSQVEVERQEAVESPKCAEVKDCEEAYEERRRNSSVESTTVDQLMKDSDDDVSQEDPDYVPEERSEDGCEYNSDEEVIKDDADDQELVEVVEEANQDSNAPSEEVSQDDPQEDPPEVEEVVASQEDSQEVEKTIKVEKDKLCFKGNGGVDKKDYGVELKLLNEIDPEKYKYAMQPRAIDFALEKKDAIPYWNRLLETKVKQHWLKVDFSKWKEKDDNYDESSGALPTKYVQINTGDKESGELVTDSVLVMPAVSAQPREGIGVLKDSIITHTLSKLCINGAVIAVSIEKLFNFDRLLEHLTRIACKQGTLLNIFSPFDGSYVCSKKLNYTSLVIVRDAFRWRGWSGSGLNLDLAVRPRTASAQLAHSSLVGGGVHGRGDQWRKTK